MADTIRRRIRRQDPMMDASLEPVADWVRRVGARRLMRMAWTNCTTRATLLRHLEEELRLPFDRLEGWLTLPHFGAAWALSEASSPALMRRLVPRADVREQTVIAHGILSTLANAQVHLTPRG
jgi:hypothetical protein